MHERAPESPGATDIREEYGDARLEQRRKELVVARAALTFRPTVQEDHGADRLDTRLRAKQPAGVLQPVTRGDGLQGRVGRDRPTAGLAVDGLPLARPRIDEL